MLAPSAPVWPQQDTFSPQVPHPLLQKDVMKFSQSHLCKASCARQLMSEKALSSHPQYKSRWVYGVGPLWVHSGGVFATAEGLPAWIPEWLYLCGQTLFLLTWPPLRIHTWEDSRAWTVDCSVLREFPRGYAGHLFYFSNTSVTVFHPRAQ